METFVLIAVIVLVVEVLLCRSDLSPEDDDAIFEDLLSEDKTEPFDMDALDTHMTGREGARALRLKTRKGGCGE